MSLIMSLSSGLADFLIVFVCICVVLPSCMMNSDDHIAYIGLNIVKFHCL